MFLIYINNLCDGTFNGHLTAFADDIALSYRASSIDRLQNYIQQDLKLIRYWFDRHYMVLSDKTKVQIFDLKERKVFNRACVNHQFSCQHLNNCTCFQVLETDVMKYLGLYVDFKLTWEHHINKLKVDMYKIIRKFYFLRDVCPTKVLLNIYHALVSSRISYGITCWGGTFISRLNPIVILQKAVVRIIRRVPKITSSWPIFKSFKIFPLRHLYVFKVLRSFFNRSSNIYCNLNRNYNLRHSLTVPVPRSRLRLHQQFYTCSAPRFFNMFAHRIKRKYNLRVFSADLKLVLLSMENIEQYFTFLV